MNAMIRLPPIDRDRAVSALGVAAIHAVLGWALLTGLGVSVPHALEEPLAMFDVRSPPPPRPIEPPPQTKDRAPEREGRASPPNLKSVATPVVAPDTPIPIPPPVVTAPIARDGVDPTAGAARIAGPGYGAGGIGDGTGSGGYGDGSGGGGGGGRALQHVAGRIKNSDYPRDAFAARASGTVGLRFVVGVTGRVTSCAVTRSSGNRALDATTCRLILERFRYRPSIDRNGRPFADTVTGEHVWQLSERFVGREEYDRDDNGYDPDDD